MLFVAHGAERSGPPVMLANLQRWLAAHEGPSFATLLTRGGPMLEDYRRWGPVRILDPRWTMPRVAQQAAARMGWTGLAGTIRNARDRLHLVGWDRPDLIYVNTVSPATLRSLALLRSDAPVLVHVHELEVALRYHLDEDERQLLRTRATCYVAASHAVADNLIARHKVDPALVEVFHEFVEPVEPASGAAHRAQARTALGLERDAFVVVGSGMTEWRKGPDLFVGLAAEVRRRTDRPVTFVWVGGETTGPTWWPLDHEARHLGVDGVVRFVGAQEQPGSWFRVADAFAVTSREDAFPLAALEAASAEVPLVTFDTGGMSELVAVASAGVVVPYPELGAMAEVLVGWSADEVSRRRHGADIARYVRTNHLSDVAAPRLAARLVELMGVPEGSD